MCKPARNRQAHYAMLLGIALATTGWAQEADAPDEESSATETPVEAVASDELVNEGNASEEVASEEIDVDDGSYIDAEEDDFRPSEEVSADQSITFPTDI